MELVIFRAWKQQHCAKVASPEMCGSESGGGWNIAWNGGTLSAVRKERRRQE